MLRWLSPVAAILAFTLSGVAHAGSVGTYSGCKKLKDRAACEKCVAGGNFYQPGGSCGMAEGMHKSMPAGSEKPPPRPTAMPKVASDYATIPAGTFDIGARALDQHKDESKEVFDVKVTITRPFLMRTTEVTHAEWYFLTGALKSNYDKTCGLDCPVGYVNWKDALVFLNMLSKKEGLEQCYEIKGDTVKWPKGLDCKGYRLPTEAEWEYAARGGNEEPTYGPLKDIAWYYDNSDGKPHPVGKKQKNAYGLYDTLGSAWEWVWDIEDYKPYKEDCSDPITGGLEAETNTGSRIVRGGSYRDSNLYVRVQHRYQYPTSSGDQSYSFRPVRTK